MRIRPLGGVIRILALSMLMGSMLTGCIGLAVQGGEAVVDRSTIAIEERAATEGNPTSQYKLGDAYCCSARGERSLFKNNQTATVWLCRAARQDYAPAKLRLARVYSGDRITGMALMERIISVADAPKDAKPVAFMWAKIAAADANQEISSNAVKLADSLETAMSLEEHRHADDLLAQDWRQAPCEWRDVFPPST